MTGIAIPQRVVDGEMMRVEAEDNVQLLLDFGDATFGSITTGFTMQRYRSPAVEIYGTRGTIQLMGDTWAPEGYELWRNEVGAWQVFAETNRNWSWTAGIDHLVECILQGVRPAVTPEYAYHVLEIMLKAKESSSVKRAVPVTSTFTLPSCTV